MLRLIKIIFNALIIVLAFIGFNAIGGEKYVEAIKVNVTTFWEEYVANNANKIGDFSTLNEEFQIDNSVNFMGYKAIIAEHKASGQKMAILDSGKKSLLTKEDIESDSVEKKLKNVANKFKYNSISIKELNIVERGQIEAYGQKVPYVRFNASVTKLPFSDVAGMVASITTPDGQEKLIVSIAEKKKYSQLITTEFYKGVKANGDDKNG